MKEELKLNFWQILMSPFISMRSMVSSESDLDSELELREDSSDKTEVDLAQSSKNIDKKVSAYGNSGKSQKRAGINNIKVDQKDLKTTEKVETKQTDKQIEDDRSR